MRKQVREIIDRNLKPRKRSIRAAALITLGPTGCPVPSSAQSWVVIQAQVKCTMDEIAQLGPDRARAFLHGVGQIVIASQGVKLK